MITYFQVSSCTLDDAGIERKTSIPVIFSDAERAKEYISTLVAPNKIVERRGAEDESYFIVEGSSPRWGDEWYVIEQVSSVIPEMGIKEFALRLKDVQESDGLVRFYLRSKALGHKVYSSELVAFIKGVTTWKEFERKLFTTGLLAW